MSEKNSRPTLDEAFAGLLKDTVSEFRTDLRLVSQQVHEHGGKIAGLDQRLATMERDCNDRHHRISEQMRGLRNGLDNTGEILIEERGVKAGKTALWKQIAGAVTVVCALAGALKLGEWLHSRQSAPAAVRHIDASVHTAKGR